MKKEIARYAAFTVLLFTLFTLLACRRDRYRSREEIEKMELDAVKHLDPTGKSKSVSVKDAYVAGELGEYIAIEDGRYEFGISNDGNYSCVITVKLRLLKEYPGDPQAAADTFLLIPLAQGSLQIEEIDSLLPDTRGKARFASLLSGQAGATAPIPFSGTMGSLSNGSVGDIETAARVFDAVAGFEGDTFTRYVFAVAPISSSEQSREETAKYRGWIHQGLMEHRLAYRIRLVDTSQIDQIAAQHKFELSDWSDPNKAAEIGRALNANVLVTSIVIVYHGTLNNGTSYSETTISVTVLDVNTMEVLGVAETNYIDESSSIRGMQLNLK